MSVRECAIRPRIVENKFEWFHYSVKKVMWCQHWLLAALTWPREYFSREQKKPFPLVNCFEESLCPKQKVLDHHPAYSWAPFESINFNLLKETPVRVPETTPVTLNRRRFRKHLFNLFKSAPRKNSRYKRVFAQKQAGKRVKEREDKSKSNNAKTFEHVTPTRMNTASKTQRLPRTKNEISVWWLKSER